MLLQDVLKSKHFLLECRPNFGSFCPLPGPLRAIVSSALNPPPPLQISAYATGSNEKKGVKCINHALSKENLTIYQSQPVSLMFFTSVFKAIQ